MATLFAHGQSMNTLFELMGKKENGMTKSVGWTLANSSSFRTTFATELGVPDGFSEHVQFKIQEHVQDGGITDIEIIDPQYHHHVVIEAKRGFVVPDREEQWLARQVDELGKVNGIPIIGVSWRIIRRLAEKSMENAPHAEKRLLGQFIEYLHKVMTVQNQYSNQVYVVSLSTSEFAVSENGRSITWADIVENHDKYFHPLGGGAGGWPVEPPNYIAFRYHGRLQSIHHVQSYEVVDEVEAEFNLKSRFQFDRPHYLYDLGGPIRTSTDQEETGALSICY